MSEKKKYFYYVRWWLSGDDELPEGLYHSTIITEEKPKEFLSNIYDDEFIGEYYLKQFNNWQEMNEYWKSLPKKYPNHI